MKKKTEQLIFFLILVIGIANLVYWGMKKEGYHLDELYSYGYVCQFNGDMAKDRDNTPFLDNWHNSEYFLDYYNISDEEAFDYSKAFISMKRSCHPPLYYLLLFTINSIVRSFSKWSGISINVAAYAVTMFLLYYLTGKFTKSSVARIAVCVIHGFSLVAVSMVVFIRMYALLTMSTLLFVVVQGLFWEKLEEYVRSRKRYLLYLEMVLSIILGTMSQYLFCVFAFFSCGFFCFWLLKRKQIRLLIEYGISAFGGVCLCFIVWPYMIYDFIKGRGNQTITNIVKSTPKYSDYLKSYFNIVSKELFGNLMPGIVIAVLILVLALIAMYFIKKDKFSERIEGIKQADNGTAILYWFQILVSVLGYFFVIAKIAPYRNIRYVSNICPLLVLLIITFMLYSSDVLFKREYIKYVLYAAVLGITISGYFTYEVSFIYPERAEYVKKIEENSEYPIAFIYNEEEIKKQSATNNSVYFLYGQDIFVTDVHGVDTITKHLSERVEDGLIVFLSRTYEEDAEERILKDIETGLSFGKTEYLFTNGNSKVYKMTR